MSMVILACDAMLLHLNAAQEKMGTHIPVVEIDRRLHAVPADMRKVILEELEKLPAEYDTVLLAMGFCGGSLDNVISDRRLVIPRVDDCITLLLHTDDTWHANLKVCRHMYFRDNDEYFNVQAIYNRMLEQYGEKKANKLFKAYFVSYTNADIIETGCYNAHDPDYVADVHRQAVMIHSEVNYVPGSNIIFEKLVSGRWDEQFVVAEPGTKLCNNLFV